jgi:hypothetical protein
MCGAAAQISDLSQQPSVSADPTQHRSDGSFPPPCASGAVEHSEGETEGVQKEEKDGHDSKGGGASGAACGNLRILTRRHATLRMGVSEVSGWGVFSTRGLERDEFVYEYMGEVVSHDEADRRGSIYDKFNHSFLFNLNSATVVDAARKGNKVFSDCMIVSVVFDVARFFNEVQLIRKLIILGISADTLRQSLIKGQLLHTYNARAW